MLALLCSVGGWGLQKGASARLEHQLTEYRTRADGLVSDIEGAMQPGYPHQLSPENVAVLKRLHGEALRRFPQLRDQPLWVAESSQLVAPQEARRVTPQLDGLLVLATVADDPAQTAWVATVTVDMARGRLLAFELNDTLAGGYVPPALAAIGPDGALPMIRRTVRAGVDVRRPGAGELNEGQLGVLVYDRAGALWR